MTFLGKLFVLFNVAMSLFMAFAAFGLYVNGVDWGYDVAKPNQIGGVLKERQDEIAQLASMQVPSEKAWKAERAKLWAAEDARRADIAFYVKELDHNRNKATPDNAPGRAVVIESFRAKRDNTGRPVMKVAKIRGDKEKEDELTPLGSRAYYEAQLKAKQEENLKILTDVEKQVQEDIRLTKQIYDKDTKRGLRTDLVDERVKRQGVQAERRLVAPLYVNTAVESELSLKRLETMQARIDELKAYIKKRGLDPELTKR
jgi:hypothetical protein